MTQAQQLEKQLRHLPRDQDLETATKSAVAEAGGTVVRDEQVDYSEADGAVTIYRLPDSSRLVWFRLWGCEELETRLDQIPSHFDNVIEESDLSDEVNDSE